MKKKIFKTGAMKRLFSIMLSVILFTSLIPTAVVFAATVDCPDCAGKGTREVNCNSCSGGKVPCTECGGSGFKTSFVDGRLSMLACARNVNCTYCNGVGRTNVDCSTCNGTGNLHQHSYSNWKPVDINSHKGTCECDDTTTVDHSWVRSADGATTSCAACGAYVTVKATSGVTPKTVKDCVEIKTNLPTAPNFIVMDTSTTPAEEVALNTSVEGNYQAVAQVQANVNPYADFTLTNPKTTAATGDNRPIELLFVGFAAMSVLAAAAFTMDRKRR